MIGTGLLANTLSLTRQPTHSARAVVDVTRDIGYAQNRAYIFSDEVLVTQFTDADGTKAVDFVVIFISSGSTPAKVDSVVSFPVTSEYESEIIPVPLKKIFYSEHYPE